MDTGGGFRFFFGVGLINRVGVTNQKIFNSILNYNFFVISKFFIHMIEDWMTDKG